MYSAIVVLTAMGLGLGYLLGLAARHLRVDSDPVVEKVEAVLPGSNCGQCGFPGCGMAAAAMARGEAELTCCPPGGRALAEELAAMLGVTVDLSGMADAGPRRAWVDEGTCIGCVKCLKVCPTDAIVGAPKQLHGVLPEACTGCTKCIEFCPTGSLQMIPVPVTLANWRWPRPLQEAA